MISARKYVNFTAVSLTAMGNVAFLFQRLFYITCTASNTQKQQANMSWAHRSYILRCCVYFCLVLTLGSPWLSPSPPPLPTATLVLLVWLLTKAMDPESKGQGDLVPLVPISQRVAQGKSVFLVFPCISHAQQQLAPAACPPAAQLLILCGLPHWWWLINPKPVPLIHIYHTQNSAS